jgi:hypothetical protein
VRGKEITTDGLRTQRAASPGSRAFRAIESTKTRKCKKSSLSGIACDGPLTPYLLPLTCDAMRSKGITSDGLRTQRAASPGSHASRAMESTKTRKSKKSCPSGIACDGPLTSYPLPLTRDAMRSKEITTDGLRRRRVASPGSRVSRAMESTKTQKSKKSCPSGIACDGPLTPYLLPLTRAAVRSHT